MVDKMTWHDAQVPGLIGNDKVSSVKLSNSSLLLPEGLGSKENWASLEECKDLAGLFDLGGSIWAGFEQRRRLQTWSVKDEDLPDLIRSLSERLSRDANCTPSHVTIEEYPRSQLQTKFSPSKTMVTTFETSAPCDPSESFLAILPISASMIEAINRPKVRAVDCWELYTEKQHSSGLVLQPGTLYLKRGEYLREWRSRISAIGPTSAGEGGANTANSRYIVVKFHNLSQQRVESSNTNHKDLSEFGYNPNPSDSHRVLEEPPPLRDLLTIVVTTSPIKSNPSTELIERVFDTFQYGGEEFAYKCRKVLVCDGCREKDGSVSTRHANSKQAMRNGIVDSAQLENYVAFKEGLRQLCSEAPDNSPFANTTVEELSSRQGYGFALRHALRECVKTPYVIVIQHDRTFMRRTPIEETIKTMWHNRNVKYVGMSMRSNLLYRDIFLGKFGRQFMHEMAECVFRPPELIVEREQYGPDSASTRSMDFNGQERLKENILALVETYKASQQNLDHKKWMEDNPLPPGKWQMSLIPTFFWYDNIHICETEFYRDFIFNPKYKMVVKGGFVEDKLSPVIKKTVDRIGLAQAHQRFGCFLLDDASGCFFTGHLDGGSYLTRSQKEAVLSSRSRQPTR